MSPEIAIKATPPQMIGRYVTQPGQSIYDICLQTYGTIELLVALMQDNSIVSTLQTVLPGKVVTFDKSKIKDTAIFSRNVVDNVVYATMYAPPFGFADTDIELREQSDYEMREDGGLELR